jgi:hypothetical protein
MFSVIGLPVADCMGLPFLSKSLRVSLLESLCMRTGGYTRLSCMEAVMVPP